MVLTRLKHVMEDKQISVEELAAKTFMSARSILNAKREKGVSLNTAKRLAKGLKVTLGELM